MSDEEIYPVALQIRALTGLVTKLSRADLERRLEARGLAVGALPFGVMQLLSRQAQTISELSRTMRLTPATLVPVVDTLERKGLVKRGRDPHDRRRTPLSLTEQGAGALAGVPLVDEDDTLVRSLESMGEEKGRRLLALLRELANQMAEKDVAQEIAQLSNSLHRPLGASFQRTAPSHTG
ncbi:MAG: MarR family transcriptional regulator [Chloroflexi bacterium]|nr:MarR family transcriptional regulator [Chloroflexota bacterium]